ncbi:hypothetical protein [Clostridium saccharoperbutylacetonicum]|uniref:hypothetical protein n=1 Tax=Clostridium saccharoperbutylacetonicum TaxID=36745 RepID=UPI000983B999|nr:hypothetical protein [Clostridium saccharoperbutylacetonicum]AQR94240.1 hypothetical protein CLSAP_15470 [Clostridium saccharoperbutylacetonicum]NSB29940.1 hypothetical protein [Clostridium saccharoperbutylacetonicum]
MVIPIDKEKLMDEFKEKYVIGYFEKEYPKILDNLKENKEKLKETIISKFNEVCNKAKKIQEENLKKEIKYIYISYLRTSIMENSGTYRIDLYDDRWFLDKEECSVNIDFNCIYEALFNHEKELQEKRKAYNRAITEMDIEKIKLKEANKYHEIGIKFLEAVIGDLVECQEYKEMKKDEEINIFAGEFRDETILIYETPKEK